MKTGFKDRTEIKNQKPEDKPKGHGKSPWDFRCPQYDERTSCFVKAGTNYGIGIKQPVGSENDSGKSPIPFGRVNTLNTYER